MDPTQPPTQEPLQTPVQIPDFEPKPNYLKTIIFSILGVTLLTAIIFLYFQNQKLQKQVLNLPVSPTIQIPSPTSISETVSSISISPDETAGWKTYNSNLLDISIKYPNNWFLESENNNDKSFRIQNYDPATAPGRGYNPIEDKGKFSVVFYDWSQKLNAKTVDELKQELNKEKECFYIGDPAGERISLNEQTKNINSLVVFSRDTRCSEASVSSLQKEYFILDGKDKIIKIFPGLDVESGIEYLDQILLTFKFVN